MSGNDFRGDVVLQRRYEKLYGQKPGPKPAPRPVATLEVFELVKQFNSSLTPEERGERERIRASAEAMRRIEAELAKEAEQAEAQQQSAVLDVVNNTALGQVLLRRR
jgi:hypothetical protein